MVSASDDFSFWGGPVGQLKVTFCADTDVIPLSAARARRKSVRSHLSTADLAALDQQPPGDGLVGSDAVIGVGRQGGHGPVI